MQVLVSLARAIVRGAIAFAIIAVLWSVTAAAVGSPISMPTLAAVVGRLGQLCLSPWFWQDAWISAQHILLGYVAALIGIPLGLALASAAPMRFGLGALVNGLAAAPLIAGAPLMTLWFGIGDGSKIALAFAVTAFTLASDIMSGLARPAPMDGAQRETPGTTRCILAAMRRAFVLAVGAVLVGEMVATTHGLGYLLMASVATFDTPQGVAALLFVSLPCGVVVAICRWAEREVA